MTQIFSTLYVFCCCFVLAQAALMFDKCTSHDQCPSNARCRPTGCDGYTCRCDDNFVSSDDKTRCLQARKMGYSCNANQGKCLSNFAVCQEESVCRCNALMEPTPEGRCKDPEFSVLEESCQRTDCSGGTVCQDGTCVCPPHMRRLTVEEFWIDPMLTAYCIDKDFSVHFCNGSRIEIPLALRTTPPSLTDASTASKTTLTPGTFTKIISLIENEAKIYEICSRHQQCPEHAQCRPQGCKGFSCLCDEGYMASVDKKSCVKAARVNEPCDVSTSCISPFAVCDGVCRCLDVFMPTMDGRCKLPDISFVGEECSTDECEYPATCVDGFCRCVGEYRAITSEEFWVDPTNIWQCARNDSSSSLCNGMPVTLPTPMSPPSPQVKTDTTTTSILTTTNDAASKTAATTTEKTSKPTLTTTITENTPKPPTTTTTATTTGVDILTRNNIGATSRLDRTNSVPSSTTEETSEGPGVLKSGTDMSSATTTSKSTLQNVSLTVTLGNGIEASTPASSADETTTSITTSLNKETSHETTGAPSGDRFSTSNAGIISTTSPVKINSENTKSLESRQNNSASTETAGVESNTFPTDDNSIILKKTRIPSKVKTAVDSFTKENSSIPITDRSGSSTMSPKSTEEKETSTVSISHTTSNKIPNTGLDIEGTTETLSSDDSTLKTTPSELLTSKPTSIQTTSVAEKTRGDSKLVSRETTQSAQTQTSPLMIVTTIRSMTMVPSSTHPSSVSTASTTKTSRNSQHASTPDQVSDGKLSTSSKEADEKNLSRKNQKYSKNDSTSSTPKMSDNFPFRPEIHKHDHYLCESHSFHCSEILCIPSSWVCDGEKNCPDGRDEASNICNKDRICPSDEYKCSNFRCIPGSWLCDGEEDCPKKEDESAAAGCFIPHTETVTETVTFESIISMNTTTSQTNMTLIPDEAPKEKSYTASAGLGSLESIAIAAAAGLVFLINVIGIILALTRRNRRKLEKKQPSTMATSVTSSDDAESGSFKIPRPNVLYPPYYVKEDWNTWNSSHFTQYAEQMYAMDEHSDFYPGSLKTL